MLTILLAWAVLFGYSCWQKTGEFSIVYRDYDLFKLRGKDTLPGENATTLVRVKYKNNFPVNITYSTPENSISFVLEDSFALSGHQTIYQYATSNLHGSNTGREYNHGWGFESNKYVLFISLTDTIICKDYSLIDTSDHSFQLNLFIQKQDTIVNFSSEGKGYIYGNASLKDKKDLYSQYVVQLTRGFREYPERASMASNLIPYPKEIFFYKHEKHR